MSQHMVRSVRRCWWLVVLLGVAGCGAPVLSVDDTVTMNGGGMPLVAYVGRSHMLGLRSELEHIPVTFFIEGEKIGTNQSDGEGRAAVMVPDMNGSPNAFKARARVGGQSLEATGRIFQWQQGRGIIAVDIDHTISQTNYRRLVLKERVAVSPPVPGARETLAVLAKDYQILYLTARPRFLIEKTREWLAYYGFPPGPVVAAPGVRDAMRQLRFKQTILRQLRERWPDMRIGIGNRESDIDAYAHNRMLPLIIYTDGEQELHSYAVGLINWQVAQQFFEANREILTNPARLDKVIDGRLMLLQPLIPYEAAKSHYKPKPFERGD